MDSSGVAPAIGAGLRSPKCARSFLLRGAEVSMRVGSFIDIDETEIEPQPIDAAGLASFQDLTSHRYS